MSTASDAGRDGLAYTAAALGMARHVLWWAGAMAVLAIGWLAGAPPRSAWAVCLVAVAIVVQGFAAVCAARAAYDAAVFGWWARQPSPQAAIEHFDRWLAERGRAATAPPPTSRSVADRTRGGLRWLRLGAAWSAAGTLMLAATAATTALQAL